MFYFGSSIFLVNVFMSFLEVGRGGGCALNTRNIFANAPTVCPTTHLRNIGHDYPGGKIVTREIVEKNRYYIRVKFFMLN